MNDPAVLFYTSDFLTGVMDMTMEERGQYITLLCYQHQKGHIKEETIRLLVGLVSVNVLKHFIKDEEGLFFNKRMDLEKEKRRVFTESRRENGKKGGRPKKTSGKPKKNLVDNHMDNHMGNHMGNENENDNTNYIYNYNFNDNVNKLLVEYLRIREKRKYVITENVVKRLCNKLIEYGKTDKEKEQIILNAINGGWKDFYKLNENLKIQKEPDWFNKNFESNIVTEEQQKDFEKKLQELRSG